MPVGSTKIGNLTIEEQLVFNFLSFELKKVESGLRSDRNSEQKIDLGLPATELADRQLK